MSQTLDELHSKFNATYLHGPKIIGYWFRHPDFVGLADEKIGVLFYLTVWMEWEDKDTVQIDCENRIQKEHGTSKEEYRLAMQTLIDEGFVRVIDQVGDEYVYQILVPDNLDHNPELLLG